MAYDLHARNQKLIHAVQQRASQCCPQSLALIGVYGSFATGEYTERSDLDLLIVIHDDAGWQLSCCFIQDDLDVAHDLYCTTWDALEASAQQYSPATPKLLEAQIVWSDSPESLQRLQQLQARARDWMTAPYDAADLAQSEAMYGELCTAYADLMTADGCDWYAAALVDYAFEELLAQLRKTCYLRSVRHRLEELPADAAALVDALCRAPTPEALRSNATALLKLARALLEQRRVALRTPPAPATAAALEGSYEECVSNWRGKARTAAETGNAHLALNALANLHHMLAGIGREVNIGTYDALRDYDPADPAAAAAQYDAILAQYAKEYARVGLPIRHYADIDEMIADYTRP